MRDVVTKVTPSLIRTQNQPWKLTGIHCFDFHCFPILVRYIYSWCCKVRGFTLTMTVIHESSMNWYSLMDGSVNYCLRHKGSVCVTKSAAGNEWESWWHEIQNMTYTHHDITMTNRNLSKNAFWVELKNEEHYLKNWEIYRFMTIPKLCTPCSSKCIFSQKWLYQI